MGRDGGGRPGSWRSMSSSGDLAGAWGVSAERGLADLVPVAGELDGAICGRPAMPIPRARCWSSVRERRAPRPSGIRPPSRGSSGSPGERVASCSTRHGALAAGPRRGGGGDPALLVCPPTVAAARRGRRLVDALAGSGPDRRIGLVAASGPGGAELAQAPSRGPSERRSSRRCPGTSGTRARSASVAGRARGGAGWQRPGAARRGHRMSGDRPAADLVEHLRAAGGRDPRVREPGIDRTTASTSPRSCAT